MARKILAIIFEFPVKLHKWNKFYVELFGYTDSCNLHLVAHIRNGS